VTSLPDLSDTPGSAPEAYRAWFLDAAARVLAACPADGVVVFYQTDEKRRGRWIDKGYLCGRAAEDAGLATLWHRIVLRAAPGASTFGRPAYTHMICFSREALSDAGSTAPDVMPGPGESSWTRGMGQDACLAACRFVLERTPTRTIVDPFCGRGTVLAAANALGLEAVGVEISRKRAREARSLRIVVDG
jgi:hypothetical protein